MRWVAVATIATTLIASGACGGKASNQSTPLAIPSAGAGTASANFGSGGLPNGASGSSGSSGTGLTAAGAAPGAAGDQGGGARASGAVSGAGGTGELSAGGRNGGAGQASAGTNATGIGGVSAGTTGDAGAGDSAGGGQAGEQSCIVSNGTCSCGWLTPSCQNGKSLFVGPECPPTFDDARLVVNWPLAVPPMTGGQRQFGEYEECDDGRRAFMFSQCGEFEEVAFDADGQLEAWTENLKSCVSLVCSTPPTPPSVSCMICEMRSDPPGEGMSCFARGTNNGPTPSCISDAAGHWRMPPLCDD